MAATVGVLALQGAVDPHLRALAACGVVTRRVRSADDLAEVDGLVLPGGESTTVSMLLERTGLGAPLTRRVADGLPLFGTCAGMILCATRIIDGRDDQVTLGAIDLTVRRNAFGRQIDSFETDLAVTGLDTPFPAVFIRAPVAESIGDDVEVLAAVDGRPVLCRQGPVLVSSFHPELSADRRIHEMFIDLIT